MNRSSTDLWPFAKAFYSLPGVEAALIGLQDEAGLDVPLLLALLHAGRGGLCLDAETLAQLIATAHLWQQRAVGPLRKARRALARPIAGTPDADREHLRAQVKTAELEAERLLLEAMGAALAEPGTDTPEHAVRANIGAYLAVLGPKLSAQNEAALAFLAQEAARFIPRDS